jgi:regulator of protease activity HflC (stomatin/prohibitin superfamily)
MTTKFKTSLLTIILILSAALSSCTRIDAGYEGILIKQYGTDKGVSDVTLVTGRVTYNPWTEDVEQMPLFVKTVDYDPFTVNSKDGSEFTVDPTISIKVNKGMAPGIYQKYRVDIDEIIDITVLNYVKNAFRLQFNKYTADEITSKREEFEIAVEKSLSASLEAEGFHLETLTSGIHYPETLIEAINAKNKAVQDALRIENEVKSAEAQAKIKVAKASGDGDALVIQAKAEAEANRLRRISLDGLLIQQQFIEKWDGKLPVYGQVPTMFKNIN